MTADNGYRFPKEYRRNIQTLTKRRDYLVNRIASRGPDLSVSSFDVSERRALDCALELFDMIQEIANTTNDEKTLSIIKGKTIHNDPRRLTEVIINYTQGNKNNI